MSAMGEKTKGELLAEELCIKTKNGGELLSDEQIAEAFAFCEDYKVFLDHSKTEREATKYTVEMLKTKGYKEFDKTKQYFAGDKIYYNNRGKALIFAVVGAKPLSDGVKILASHIDSPRLDLKPRPLYEEGQIALFKTHYYGGIKKYQWSTTPLALHGIIIKKDGTKIDVNVGYDDSDPVFCVTDLLPHLSQDQMKREVKEVLKGEELNVLVGSLPFKDDKASERVKLNIMRLLNEKYGIVEADFLSAELTMVPYQNAKDVGFDKSFIGAYGHDDKVCAYTSLMAALDVSNPPYTVVTVFADKEEVGSNGNTGLDSDYLKFFIEDLAKPHGIEGRTVLSNSKCLSADVNAAFDPTFPDVHEKKNAAYVNYGVVVTKYTGHGGKYDTNDSSAEFCHEVRNILDNAGVLWQTGELGKVDQGGGGTVAKYISAMNVDVIDIGVPMLSMHAPFELVAKIDVYMTYKAFLEFVK